jgi:ribosomal protein S12 methylthiotransferase
MSKTKRIDLPVLQRENGTTPVVGAGRAAPRVGILTLGCDKNTVDSERILARLAASGANAQAGFEHADVIVINTCGFIDAAKEESIEAIFDAVRLKREGRVKAVVAMGCLVQRYKAELIDEVPEIDAFLGLTEIDQLVPLLRTRGLLPESPASMMERPLRMLSTRTPHTSYLKISEGCDHTCAFCAIPLMRGKHRSTPIELLVKEANELAGQGVVELNIVSQDTTWYGRDIVRGLVTDSDEYFIGRPFAGMAGVTTVSPPSRKVGVDGARHGLLPELLRTLVRETDIPWLRLFYMYPSGIQRELVELIASEPKLLPYLDMPLQHGSDRILERMRRPERQKTIRERVQWLRDAVPDLALRTTLIVGFPGETDDDFAQLMALVEEIQFDYLGAFTYSPEEGTTAALMPDDVADSLKRERLEQLLDLQRTITLEKNEARVGATGTVLIDRVARGSAIGRTQGQALEVDGVVRMRAAQAVKPGDFVQVRITDAMEHDLAAEILQDN